MAKGYGGKVVTGDETEIIAGFLRVGKDLARNLVKCSAEELSLTGFGKVLRKRSPAKWAKRTAKESLGDYHARSMQEEVSLVFHEGRGTPLPFVA